MMNRDSSLPTRSRKKLRELESAVLRRDFPEYGLERGDVGTVVLVHPGGGYELEFMTLDGKTVAVVSVSWDDVRPIGKREIPHARIMPEA